MTLLDRWVRRAAWRADIRADEAEVDAIVHAWERACEGAGLVREVDTVTGPTIIPPKLTHIVLGPPRVLTVCLQPGMTVSDVKTLAPRLAPHLGAYGLRIEPRGLGAWCVVTLLDSDPLADTLPLGQVTRNCHLLLGRDEAGQDVTVDPVELPHIICQGQTRSGKSTWLYGLLTQLAAGSCADLHITRHPGLIVAGVDPSGITLRPFADTHHADWQATGLASLDAIEKTLSDLVAEMDGRLAAMPAGCDVLPTGAGNPLMVVVLEEWPATLRALDAADPKQGKRVRGLVARLLAESHKVGYRVVLAVQRAEATIVGAAERAQCGGRLSFRVDSADSIKLLHADADEYATGHTSSPPGIALLSWPGRPLTRIRAPHVGYPEFCAAVSGGAA